MATASSRQRWDSHPGCWLQRPSPWSTTLHTSCSDCATGGFWSTSVLMLLPLAGILPPAEVPPPPGSLHRPLRQATPARSPLQTGAYLCCCPPHCHPGNSPPERAASASSRTPHPSPQHEAWHTASVNKCLVSECGSEYKNWHVDKDMKQKKPSQEADVIRDGHGEDAATPAQGTVRALRGHSGLGAG